MKILAVIPARYESTRFPGKPLADIAGKPMIQHVYERCLQANTLSKVIVATDNQLIYDVVKDFGGEVMVTSDRHRNGTSRCAEVADKFANEYDYIINIQGDEPLINPNQINELALLFKDANAQITTQVKKETDISLLKNRNIVKAIFETRFYDVPAITFLNKAALDAAFNSNFYATDFLRNGEHLSHLTHFYKHVGIYGFRTAVLKEIVALAPTRAEMAQQLEQLRWLDHGFKIKIGITEHETISVDTPDDLEKVRKLVL